nr:MAG TPA: hypothetical protein [Caudoviricetes sp.]
MPYNIISALYCQWLYVRYTHCTYFIVICALFCELFHIVFVVYVRYNKTIK